MSGSTSLPAAAPSRPLKRCLSPAPDLTFFTPSTYSFNPKPYTPNSALHAQNHSKLPPSRNNAPLAQHIPLMDPSPLDPGVIFIHPPFTGFPMPTSIPKVSLIPSWPPIPSGS
ncbi:hypothetical protein JVU11DRAFT_5246 [Chiua virens]|nr:hypothetical protein JVU11DRAFT_5246 [Chiua virens]